MPLARARRSIDRLRSVATGALRLDAPELRLDPALARALFASQLYCRITDVEAHELRARNEGYYTICSAGHEGNVALGHLTRATDPALLHYRSGAFFLARARHASAHDVIGPPPGVLELLLSLAASADDPISGGRHKVFGSVRWGIPPQTSTIASHLPKAVGMAVAIDRAARLRARQRRGAEGVTHIAPPDGILETEPDSIVVCSFGDASLNHSTAQGAINAAAWASFQGVPVPIALRLRGQRHRRVRTHAGGLGRGAHACDARHHLRRGRRTRPRRRVRGDAARGRHVSRCAHARVSPPPLRARVGTRRERRRRRVSLARRDRARRGSRSRSAQRAVAPRRGRSRPRHAPRRDRACARRRALTLT